MARKKYDLPYGDGSFYYSTSSRRWVGVIEAGTSSRGTRRRITVSSRDKDAAWSKLQAKRKEIMIDGLPDEGVRAGASVESWLTTWLAAREKTVRPKTYSAEASLVRKWLVPVLGRVKLDKLTPGDVRRLTAHMTGAGASTTTARYAQRIFIQALKAAIVEGHTVPERVLLVEKPKAAVSDRTAIPTSDAKALLAVAVTWPDAARWVAALLQGMRQGEVLGLTWDHVDLAGGTIDVSWQLQELRWANKTRRVPRVPDGYEALHVENTFYLVRPKTQRGQRVLPLVPWLRAALAALWDAQGQPTAGLVFTRPDGGPVRPKDDRAAWKRLQDAAEVWKNPGAEGNARYYVLHEARHTTATLLLEAGVDPEVIKSILGHSSIVTSRGYQHVSDKMAREALGRVAETLQLGA